MERVDADRFVCRNNWDLNNFLSLLHKCQKMVLEVVDVQDNLGPRGWYNMAHSFSLLHEVYVFHAHREDMLSAKREDLKTIWDALYITPEDECVWAVHGVVGEHGAVGGGGFGLGITAMTEGEKEEEWITLEEVLDGTTFNWQKKYK